MRNELSAPRHKHAWAPLLRNISCAIQPTPTPLFGFTSAARGEGYTGSHRDSLSVWIDAHFPCLSACLSRNNFTAVLPRSRSCCADGTGAFGTLGTCAVIRASVLLCLHLEISRLFDARAAAASYSLSLSCLCRRRMRSIAAGDISICGNCALLPVATTPARRKVVSRARQNDCKNWQWSPRGLASRSISAFAILRPLSTRQSCE
eukprot:SAG31_NODE_2399_length_5776_cov_8.236216_4_plen_205_part_00